MPIGLRTFHRNKQMSLFYFAAVDIDAFDVFVRIANYILAA